MDFRILGPLEVSRDGRAVPVAGARQRELLALLLLEAGRVVSTDRLMDELWGEQQPAAGSTALRVRVSQLRKALRAGGEILVTRAPGYALLVPRDGLDLWRFERGLDEGERLLAADPARAVEALERALGEWRGAPLTDVAYAPFAQAAIVRLEELRASALELRIEAELALGRHARLIGELQELVGRHPLRERLWAQLMTALYLDGRQADALAAYRSARERLIDEIGIEPGPELRAARAAHPRPGSRARRTRTRRPRRRPGPRWPSARTGAARPRSPSGSHRPSGIEAVAVALVRDAAGLADATAGLRAAAPGARTAAFTSDATGADAVRLAAEQDAAVLLVDARPDRPGARHGAARGRVRRRAGRRRRAGGVRPGPRAVLRQRARLGGRRARGLAGRRRGDAARRVRRAPGTATRAACWPTRRSRSSAAPACARRRSSPDPARTACSRPPPAPPPS